MVQDFRDGLQGPVRLEYRDLEGEISGVPANTVLQFDDLREAIAAAISKAPLPT